MLALLVALPLAGCDDPADEGQIDVTNIRLIQQSRGYPELSGYVVNRTSSTIAADVGVRLLDSKNLPIDEVVRFSIGRVAPGDSARFIKMLDVDARGARLDYVIPG